MDASEIIARLRGEGFFEISEKVTFECCRTKNGGTQRVTVEVFDRGPEGGRLRYHCIARGDDGTLATGNPGSTIEEVFSTLHWNDLNRAS